MTDQDTENFVVNDEPEKIATEEPLPELESEQSKREKNRCYKKMLPNVKTVKTYDYQNFKIQPSKCM